MRDPDLLGLFIEPLERAGVPYMITGGVASTIYGDPRFTRDIDVVMELPAASISSLVSAFDAAEFYVPPREVLAEEAARASGGHFNVVHMDTALRADVYLTDDDPLHAWAFERRVRLQVGNGSIWVAPIEYVIVRKLEYLRHSGSERHLRDVAMMLEVSLDVVDREALEAWCARLGLEGLLERSRAHRAR